MMEEIQLSFNGMQKQSGSNRQISFADLIVLGGNAAIEEAARRAGHTNVHVPFVAGRTDALQSQTDVDSFNALQPTMDGFRNYEGSSSVKPESALLDRAHLLTLTTPEMVVLLGGLRVLGANSDSSLTEVLTDRAGSLTNDFFTNLLDENTAWKPLGDGKLYQGSRLAGKPWLASRVDVIIGSNSQLRAIGEAYASADSAHFFVEDFVNAWSKVVMLDRFDLLHDKRVASTSETMFLWSSKRHVSRL